MWGVKTGSSKRAQLARGNDWRGGICLYSRYMAYICLHQADSVKLIGVWPTFETVAARMFQVPIVNQFDSGRQPASNDS